MSQLCEASSRNDFPRTGLSGAISNSIASARPWANAVDETRRGSRLNSS